jgi:hypothetical protein
MQLPPVTNIILGHDINANVGTNANSGQHLKETIGAYGIENRNKKGISLKNLMASLNMKITNTYCWTQQAKVSAETNNRQMAWNCQDPEQREESKEQSKK